MSDDHYDKGQELSKAGIYQILAEEAWRDGEVSRGDSELLEGLRKYLRLSNEDAMKILDIAEDKYRTHSLGRLRDFSPNQCYARALRYAYSDAVELSKREAKYLKGLRAALGMLDTDHDSILARLVSRGWSPGPADPDNPVVYSDPEDAPAGGSQLGRQPAEVSARMQALTPETDQQPKIERNPAHRPSAPVPLPPVEDTPAAPQKPEKAGISEEEQKRGVVAYGNTGAFRAAGGSEPKIESPKAKPPKRKRRKRRKRKGGESMSGSMSMAEIPAPKPKRRKRKKGKDTAKAKVKEAVSATPATPNLIEKIPPPARLVLLVGMFTGAMLVAMSMFHTPGGVIPGDPLTGNTPGRYEQLEAEHGRAAFKVKRMVIRGPDPPDGPPLDLGEAWDLYAGRDGKLYGTALYRIFQIDPKTGRAKWIAGSGLLGEPEDGQDARKAEMDPASPRVDASGRLYFRQGNSAVFRVGKDHKLERILGTRESRVVWKDGDKAQAARPGAIEQIALGAGGRLYFDEYSGEIKGPEILGRVEPGDKLRAMFLYAIEPVDHPFQKLVKTFISSGNGFENLEIGEDGGIYFVVGKSLYRWLPGQGPPKILLQEAPLDFAIDRDGALLVVQENRIERWYDLEKWTREQKFVELVAGGSDMGISTAEETGALPGTAVGYHQPRDLTIGPDGTIYLLDGAAGGTGLSRPRIDRIKRAAVAKPKPTP